VSVLLHEFVPPRDFTADRKKLRGMSLGLYTLFPYTRKKQAEMEN
jgi:hypothetical protein